MTKAENEMRTAYKRSDFRNLERGKFYQEVAKGTSVVLLDPELAKTFPTSEAVNEALRGLLARDVLGLRPALPGMRTGLASAFITAAPHGGS